MCTVAYGIRYDRISPSFRGYLETLTALCDQPVFRNAAAAGNYEIMKPRGSPLNADDVFAPSHPVIRTNRVTGWKSVFAGVGIHVTRINGVHSYEDQLIREYILRLVTRNHDCVARMHWTQGAVAIWNNSCTLHAATVGSKPCIDQIMEFHKLTPPSRILILYLGATEQVGVHPLLARSLILTRSQNPEGRH
jgi:hypothetical protein